MAERAENHAAGFGREVTAVELFDRLKVMQGKLRDAEDYASSLRADLDRAEQVIAALQKLTPERIASTLESVADDEAARPSRDEKSVQIESGLRMAATAVRRYWPGGADG